MKKVSLLLFSLIFVAASCNAPKSAVNSSNDKKITPGLNVEQVVSEPQEYTASVIQVGGEGSDVITKSAYGEEAYLEANEYVETSFNSPKDIIWLSCKDGYFASKPKSITGNETFGLGLEPETTFGIVLSSNVKNQLSITCNKSVVKSEPIKTAPTVDNNGSSSLSNDNYYTNSQGNSVHSPAYSENGGVPAGASAKCADGTYSFSQSRQGTCSHHGGVVQYY